MPRTVSICISLCPQDDYWLFELGPFLRTVRVRTLLTSKSGNNVYESTVVLHTTLGTASSLLLLLLLVNLQLFIYKNMSMQPNALKCKSLFLGNFVSNLQDLMTMYPTATSIIPFLQLLFSILLFINSLDLWTEHVIFFVMRIETRWISIKCTVRVSRLSIFYTIEQSIGPQ